VLPTSWTLIEQNAVASGGRTLPHGDRLARIPSAEIATELVTARFAPYYEIADFEPPYPTWPVLPDAFRDAPDFTPRGLCNGWTSTCGRACGRTKGGALTDLTQAEAGTGAAHPGTATGPLPVP